MMRSVHEHLTILKDVTTESPLRDYLNRLDTVPDGGYALEIEQTMITRFSTETGFALSRETLTRAYPSIREIRFHAATIPDPDPDSVPPLPE